MERGHFLKKSVESIDVAIFHRHLYRWLNHADFTWRQNLWLCQSVGLFRPHNEDRNYLSQAKCTDRLSPNNVVQPSQLIDQQYGNAEFPNRQ